MSLLESSLRSSTGTKWLVGLIRGMRSTLGPPLRTWTVSLAPSSGWRKYNWFTNFHKDGFIQMIFFISPLILVIQISTFWAEFENQLPSHYLMECPYLTKRIIAVGNILWIYGYARKWCSTGDTEFVGLLMEWFHRLASGNDLVWRQEKAPHPCVRQFHSITEANWYLWSWPNSSKVTKGTYGPACQDNLGH